MIWTAKKESESNSRLTEAYGDLERCDSLAVVPCVGSRVFMRARWGGISPGSSAPRKNVGFSPGLQEENVLDRRVNGCSHPLMWRQNCSQCQGKCIKSRELRVAHLLKMAAIFQSKGDTGERSMGHFRDDL